MSFGIQFIVSPENNDYVLLQKKMSELNNMPEIFKRRVLKPWCKQMRDYIKNMIITTSPPFGVHWAKSSGGDHYVFHNRIDREGGDPRPLIDTGAYVSGIVAKGFTTRKETARYGVGFRKGTHTVLARYLEFGGEKWTMGRPALKDKMPYIKNLVGRPHWEPTWKWGVKRLPERIREIERWYFGSK